MTYHLNEDKRSMSEILAANPEKGRCANLQSLDLSNHAFININFTEANLSYANLCNSTLFKSNLQGAYLQGANLYNTSLHATNLKNADLKKANLFKTNLHKANLEEADLRDTNLTYTFLKRANLHNTKLPSPSMVLLANWGRLSDELTTLLMRLDASNHPNPEAFTEWAEGGSCPYTDCQIQRVANFQEVRELYTPGPAPTLYEAMIMILKEKCKI